MEMKTYYKDYIKILHEELIPATGCTEPIAIAYAAATARKTLGLTPERVLVEASGNIIKNVKSVVVPNTGGLRGIEAATAAGIVAGDADKILEVIADVSPEEKIEIKNYLDNTEIKVERSQSEAVFELVVRVFAGEEQATVHIRHFHTNIISICKNGKQIELDNQCEEVPVTGKTDRTCLNVKDILDFAEHVEIDDVKEVLQRQIDFNYGIACEGIQNDWGANVGSTMLNSWGGDIKNRARAYAAAGSDARMSGCEMPVIIVSGSGNQGMTASVPVIEYAKEMNSSQEDLYRALLVANLVTIHQKTSIGRLSAFCGAVSAGAGAGAGIAKLNGGGYEEISHTLVNALAIDSGIICDGAKPSCAGKIAMAVESGILGYEMYKNGQQFYAGEGLVVKGVEKNIENVGRLGRVGMCETDKEIIEMMLEG
jgi:L-cysteine desulfidase